MSGYLSSFLNYSRALLVCCVCLVGSQLPHSLGVALSSVSFFCSSPGLIALHLHLGWVDFSRSDHGSCMEASEASNTLPARQSMWREPDADAQQTQQHPPTDCYSQLHLHEQSQREAETYPPSHKHPSSFPRIHPPLHRILHLSTIEAVSIDCF
ncbi:hypothetical protein FPQ18DRAFT_125775 [Pyronema domesticum]|nr:hypothetical protein FPQ18DRAFT_125775 [Pyronema domesticum]